MDKKRIDKYKNNDKTEEAFRADRHKNYIIHRNEIRAHQIENIRQEANTAHSVVEEEIIAYINSNSDNNNILYILESYEYESKIPGCLDYIISKLDIDNVNNNHMYFINTIINWTNICSSQNLNNVYYQYIYDFIYALFTTKVLSITNTAVLVVVEHIINNSDMINKLLANHGVQILFNHIDLYEQSVINDKVGTLINIYIDLFKLHIYVTLDDKFLHFIREYCSTQVKCLPVILTYYIEQYEELNVTYSLSSTDNAYKYILFVTYIIDIIITINITYLTTHNLDLYVDSDEFKLILRIIEFLTSYNRTEFDNEANWILLLQHVFQNCESIDNRCVELIISQVCHIIQNKDAFKIDYLFKTIFNTIDEVVKLKITISDIRYIPLICKLIYALLQRIEFDYTNNNLDIYVSKNNAICSDMFTFRLKNIYDIYSSDENNYKDIYRENIDALNVIYNFIEYIKNK